MKPSFRLFLKSFSGPFLFANGRVWRQRASNSNKQFLFLIMNALALFVTCVEFGLILVGIGQAVKVISVGARAVYANF